MFDIKTTGPTPIDLGTRSAFQGVYVSIPALIEAATLTGSAIEGRRFVDCFIQGPAVLAPASTTRFSGCNFGDVGNDPRNILMRPAGSTVIGALSVAGCVFENCMFHGIALAGDDSFISAFLATMIVEGPST